MAEKISAVLITKNEAKVIERCIKSLKGVDEIVILDTGSTDKTVEIARSLGAVVKASEPISPFHFADARNLAHDSASNDWVLVIDADEVLRAGMIGPIRKALSDPGDATAFLVTFTDRGMGTRKKKIYRKSVWKWRYRVHEQLFGGKDEHIKFLEQVVFEHLPDPDKKVRRAQNVDLLKMTIQENPEYVSAYRMLGQELMLEKKYEEAIPLLATFVEKMNIDTLEKSEAMIRLGECYGKLKRLEDACRWFEYAFQTDPRRREPLYQGGWYMADNAKTVSDLIIARDFLQRCIAIPLSAKPGTRLDEAVAWSNKPNQLLSLCNREIDRASETAQKQHK